MNLKFVTGEPALLAGKTLFVADIHVGIEYEYRQSGINMPSQTEKLLSRIESLLKQTKAASLVLIGDIKHKVPGISWQEEREVPAFLQRLAEKTEVRVVPGNHDGGLQKFVPKGVKLYPTQGGLFGNTYASHGHTWPEPSFAKAKYFIMSHSHPQVEFKDRLGYRWGERIWIRAKLNKNKILKKYPKAKTLPELIIMPAFNPLSGGIPVNRKIPKEEQKRHISPILKSAKMRTAKIFMLDGTYLGELGKL
ncbi:MAG: metallophosphoesterase [Candidatus Aenigmarchaeota archaeon]|nr:metallophosphoesterase [Candidatus Aenigmarchaeota archaeon]